MRKSPFVPLVALFLVTFGVALSLLVLTNPPVTAPPVPTMPPTATPCLECQAAWYPSPTPYNVPDQCTQTGETYQLQVPDYIPSLGSFTLAAPDGKFALVKQDATVYLKDTQSGDLKQIAVEGNATSGIEYRAHWSPDSQHVLFSPEEIDHPLMIQADLTADILTLDKAAPYSFNGWSPNSKYVVMQSSDPGMALWVYEATTGRVVYDIEPPYQPWDFGNRWSPDGEWLAYISGYYPDSNAAWQDTVVLGRMGNSEEYTFRLDAHPADKLLDTSLVWSSDSQKIALRYNVGNPGTAATEHFDIFTTENKRLRTMLWQIPSSFPPFAWSDLNANGIDNLPMWNYSNEFLSDVRYFDEGHYELVNYYPADGKTVTLSNNLDKPAFYSPVSNRIGLYMQRNNLYDIELVDWDGNNRVKMVDQAIDAGNPNWSPDGQWVAAVWATGERSTRQITLTWMKPDGTARVDLQNDFTDVRDLHWLPGDKLAYIAWYEKTGNNLEVVDLKTGERQVIIAGLESLPTFTYDADSDRLEFKWREQDGTFGFDGYHPDGTRAYHVLMTGDFERSAKPFWSPDGKTVVYKVGSLDYRGLYDEMVIVGYADGSPPLILRSGLDGLGDPLWSPDSRQFAFTQWVNRNLTLETFSPAGQRLYWTWEVIVGYTLDWSACP